MAECRQLNKVRLHQQAIFESDVFNADGNTINTQYLTPRKPGVQWSSFRFGRQKPPPSAFTLWREALSHLAPGGRRTQRLGEYIRPSHLLWRWKFDPRSGSLYTIQPGVTFEYRRQDDLRTTRNSRYTLRGTSTRDTTTLPWCSVQELSNGGFAVTSLINPPSSPTPSSHFLDVIHQWPNGRIWRDLKVTGNGTWIYDAIREGTLLSISDGSYIRELHPQLCSTAVMMECTSGRGRLSVSFVEKSHSANAFRGELLGLMTIHLILYSVHVANQGLTGSVKIFSDCTGALQTISKLPEDRIPPRWKHADILKVIAHHGRQVPFRRTYFHVKAHQDDNTDWTKLSRPSQLNCACDAAAKQRLYESCEEDTPYFLLPFESLSIVGAHGKITSDTEETLRFLAHKAEARELFHRQGILLGDQFQEVAWEHVHHTLRGLPKMFQLFAAKQVFGVSAVLGNLSKQKAYAHLGDKCPSCELHKETTAHILLCREEGRVHCFNSQIHLLGEWLQSSRTNPDLRTLILDFLYTRGDLQYGRLQVQYNRRYYKFIQSQERIGWFRLMEGMISSELLLLDKSDILSPESKLTIPQWASQFIQRLIEATHGIWIYRNLIMHDNTAGVIATKEKEQLLHEIEHQVEIGGEGLAEQDQWMAEVNLRDLATTTGERESYWLLAIRTARERHRLRLQAG